MNQCNNNNNEQKKQRLAITLDLSDPEPVRDLKQNRDINNIDLKIAYPLHALIRTYFPTLFEEVKNDNK